MELTQVEVESEADMPKVRKFWDEVLKRLEEGTTFTEEEGVSVRNMAASYQT